MLTKEYLKLEYGHIRSYFNGSSILNSGRILRICDTISQKFQTWLIFSNCENLKHFVNEILSLVQDKTESLSIRGFLF
ncbi:unnamed protein product [Moneuplotes crassus]|uniref:Uncharacterized protein n=1 Tax=Euplotes crassus TaxID=5936 RepID=A0AAD1Y5V1_EUPCR|nr:unnamed protein product [Moneuplotes crassus]